MSEEQKLSMLLLHIKVEDGRRLALVCPHCGSAHVYHATADLDRHGWTGIKTESWLRCLHCLNLFEEECWRDIGFATEEEKASTIDYSGLKMQMHPEV